MTVAITIDKYERFRPIGSGGYSQVYEAYDREHARKVAVKVLTLGADAGLDREMFERECQAMGSVSEHPNIVTVYGSGFSEEGFPYIAMELYHGTMLDRVKEKGYLPLPDVLDAGIQICAALARAHGQGILHRDIKPQNIFYSTYGDPALGDFGIASISRDPNSEKMAGLTPHYAAPEVLDGNLPVVESDIYSLGATLYTALAGHRPFARAGKDGEAALINRVMTEPPPPITIQDIPPHAERVLLGLLAKHPNDRPRSALEVGNLLRDLQGRMGLAQTPLRTATVELDNDLTVSRSGPGQQAPDSFDHDETSAPKPGKRKRKLGRKAEAPAVAAVDMELGSYEPTAGTVTIARAKSSVKPTSEYAEPEADNRRWIGAGILALVLVAVGIGVLVSSGGGGDDGDKIASPDQESVFEAPSSTVVIDLSAPATPADLVVTIDDGIASLSWEAGPKAARFQINYVVGEGEAMQAEDRHIEIELPKDRDLRCVTVTAISDNGRTSEPSEAECLS